MSKSFYKHTIALLLFLVIIFAAPFAHAADGWVPNVAASLGFVKDTIESLVTSSLANTRAAFNRLLSVASRNDGADPQKKITEEDFPQLLAVIEKKGNENTTVAAVVSNTTDDTVPRTIPVVPTAAVSSERVGTGPITAFRQEFIALLQSNITNLRNEFTANLNSIQTRIPPVAGKRTQPIVYHTVQVPGPRASGQRQLYFPGNDN